MKTHQEIFDTVLAHLRQQGHAATFAVSGDDDDQAVCAYRNAAGEKCAVGCLIPDEAYTPEMERRPADALPVRQALIAGGVNMDDKGTRDFVSALQFTHDSALARDGLHAWEDAMAGIAHNRGLTYTPPKV